MPFFCALPIGTPHTAITSYHLPSAGPYWIIGYYPDEIDLALNTNYTGPRQVGADQIQIRRATNPTQDVADILGGTADYEAGGIDPATWKSVKAKVPKQTFVSPLQEVDYLALNTSRSLFASAAARRAVNLVINRTQMAAGPRHRRRDADRSIPCRRGCSASRTRSCTR